MVLLLFFAPSLLEHHGCALALWQSFFSLLGHSLHSSSTIDISGAVTSFVHSLMCIFLGETALSTSLMQTQAQWISFVCCPFSCPWDWLFEWSPWLNCRSSWIIEATNILTIAHLMTPHRLDMILKISIKDQLCHMLRLLLWADASYDEHTSGTNCVSASVESTRYKSQYLQTCEY